MGSGTGIIHDVGIRCARYTGIEPSYGMYSQAVRKYPDEEFLHCSLEDAMVWARVRPDCFVVWCSEPRCAPECLGRIRDMLRMGGKAFLIWYDPDHVPRAGPGWDRLHPTPGRLDGPGAATIGLELIIK